MSRAAHPATGQQRQCREHQQKIMRTKIKSGEHRRRRRHGEPQQPKPQSVQPHIEPDGCQPGHGNQPQQREIRNRLVEMIQENLRKLCERNDCSRDGGILPRILNRPEPEISENSRPPENQAAQTERQNNPRAERSNQPEFLAGGNFPFANTRSGKSNRRPQRDKRRVLLHQDRRAEQNSRRRSHRKPA